MENNLIGMLYVFIWLVFLFRIIHLSILNKDYRHLFISSYFVTSAFLIGKALYSPIENLSGSFGLDYSIGTLQLIPIFLLICTRQRAETARSSTIKKTPFFILLLLFIISIFNPSNTKLAATYVAIYYILCFIFFSYVVFKTLGYKSIITGIWDGFCIVAIIELFLAILWPVLGVAEVPIFFGASDWSDSIRQRASGSFIHPNLFASIMTYVTAFFFSCYLCNYRKKRALIFTVIAFCALLLTLSRSAIIAVLIIFSLLYFVSKYPYVKLFRISTFLKFILPACLLMGGVIFFTPLKKYFVADQSLSMLDARQAHVLYYMTLISDHPYVGVGLNTHVEYFDQSYAGIELDGLSLAFASTNPVHNIYVLLIMDVGIIGLLAFLFFVFGNIITSKKILLVNKNQEDNILPLTSIAYFVAVLIHGASDYTVLSIHNMIFWLPICLITYFLNRANLNFDLIREEDVEDE